MAKGAVADIYEEAARLTDSDKRGPLAKHAIKSEAASRLLAMVDLAKSEPGISVFPRDLDGDRWLLNCSDGTLDLRTGDLRPHRRQDLLPELLGEQGRTPGRAEVPGLAREREQLLAPEYGW